jgi:hypothetical protein
MDAINTSLAGMTNAIRRFDRAATDVAQASSGASQASLESAIVETISARHQLEANAAVMRTADQMLGSLLDIRV